MGIAVVLLLLMLPAELLALSSPNIPLGSPIYAYIDKLAALGFISSDFAGIKPVTRNEAVRLLIEAEKRRTETISSPLVNDLFAELQSYLKRERSLHDFAVQAPSFDVFPLTEVKARYVYLDGAPRSYERSVHDPGGDGVFGIGAGLRPVNPPSFTVQQRGSEGTPLFENNEGIRYAAGSSLDLRFSSEAHFGQHVSLFLEPMFLTTPGDFNVRLNKGYVKFGGGSLELEVGRDANWLGFGQRGALVLSDNARNFDLIKLSSPEPLDAGFLGKFKYALIFSQFDRVTTANGERQPWFYAIKASLKPDPSFEIGINLGRQQGGPGVNNSLRDILQGLVGGTHNDNSNSLGGVELRWRLPFFRNTEAFVEFSGEDAAKFWPIVESYLAGIYLPRLTDDGKNDLRFEYFLGNNILYTHGQFDEGYIYQGMPLGDSQGGATQDIFVEYRHWFSVRESAGIDYFNTKRGNSGRIAGQAREEKNAVRGFCNLPLAARLDLRLMYGWERIHNFNLQHDSDKTNNILVAETSYRF
jgi:hypothetical protein